MRFDHFSFFVQREVAAMVGQWMDHHGGVLACLDDFIEIANCADACGRRQGTVLPLGTVFIEQVAANQVRSGHVFIACHGDQWFAEGVGHVFNETGLAAARRALQHHGHAPRVCRLVKALFVADVPVVRLCFDPVLVRYVVAVDRFSHDFHLDRRSSVDDHFRAL
jgi:hypothetical protein